MAASEEQDILLEYLFRNAMNRTDKYMSSKIPERLNKIIFWKISQETKTCPKSTIKNTPELLKLILSESLYFSLEHVSAVWEGVCFY